MTDDDKRDEHGYEVRYGFDLRTVLVLTVALLFVLMLASPFSSDRSWLIRGAGLALFGGGGALMLVNACSGKVAFRVDAAGVLLGGPPLRYEAQTALVPWGDIEAVVLWRQKLKKHVTMPWIGLARRPDAPRLPGPGQGAVAEHIVGILMTEVPGRVALAGRACTGWHLDPRRLTRAVERFAPGTPVLGGH